VAIFVRRASRRALIGIAAIAEGAGLLLQSLAPVCWTPRCFMPPSRSICSRSPRRIDLRRCSADRRAALHRIAMSLGDGLVCAITSNVSRCGMPPRRPSSVQRGGNHRRPFQVLLAHPEDLLLAARLRAPR